MFLYKIINYHIDSPFLLENIMFRCPRTATSRSCKTSNLFYLPCIMQNYVSNTFLFRSLDIFNKKFCNLDPFATSLLSFKAKLRRTTAEASNGPK